MAQATQAFDTDKVRALVMRERLFAVSEREWKHRVRGYGYAIKDSANGPMVTNLRQGIEICPLFEGA